MIEQRFSMPSLPPSKKNSKRIIRNRRTGRPQIISQSGYDTWEHETAYYMRAAMVPMEQAEVEIVFHCRTNRRRDLTNMAEGLMDALVRAGILPDDSWQCVPRLTMCAKKADSDMTAIFLTDTKKSIDGHKKSV